MQIPQAFAAGEPEEITIGPTAISALRIAPATPATGPLPCLLLQHGYGADKFDLAPVAEVTAGLGFITILPDAWGHGTRFDPRGPNHSNTASANYFVEVVQHAVEDLERIAAALRDDPTVDATRIFLGGFSLGGITAIIATEHDAAVAGVIAIAGGASPASLEASLGMAPVDAAHRAWVAAHDMG
ncbi:MAG: alpha/beta fold hydrolase, partial [Ktedonobacterales bacterium]|nr:alpha/beta fold hydrolase [Ktedonobacterales bacterium]